MQSRDRTPKRLKSGLPERKQQQQHQQQQQYPAPASLPSLPSLPRKRARSQRGNGAAGATGSPGKQTKQPSTDQHIASASERKSSHVWVHLLSPAQLKACPDVYLEPGDGDDDEDGGHDGASDDAHDSPSAGHSDDAAAAAAADDDDDGSDSMADLDSDGPPAPATKGRAPKNSSAAAAASSSESLPLLDQFLYPLSRHDVFGDGCHSQRALAILPHPTVPSSAAAARFDKLCQEDMFNLDLDDMLANTASDNIFVWLRSNTPAASTAPGSSSSSSSSSSKAPDVLLNSIEVPDPATAIKCYDSGASLYFRSSEEMAKRYVRAMSDSLGYNVGGVYANGDNRGEIEVFVSRQGHVTTWHSDFMENFTLQLRGSKKWSLKQGSVPHPLRGATPHYKGVDTAEQQLKVHRMADALFQVHNAPDFFADADEVTLTAGSVLYFPAGMWHRVEATEDSISINISMMPSTWADVVGDALKQLMWRDTLFREPVMVRDHQTAVTHLQELLNVLQASILPALSAPAILPRAALLESSRHVKLTDHVPEDFASYLSQSPKLKQQPQSYHINPLVSLFRMEDMKTAASRSSSRSDREVKSAAAVPQAAGIKRKRGQSSSTSLLLSSAAAAPPSPPSVTFLIHQGFGNESLDSLSRVELSVAQRYVSLMDWLSAGADAGAGLSSKASTGLKPPAVVSPQQVAGLIAPGGRSAPSAASKSRGVGKRAGMTPAGDDGNSDDVLLQYVLHTLCELGVLLPAST